MKLPEGFIMTEVSGEHVVIPTGDAADALHGIIRLNDTGKDIWDALVEGKDETAIVAMLVEQYEVDEETARRDVHGIVETLRNVGVLKD